MIIDLSLAGMVVVEEKTVAYKVATPSTAEFKPEPKTTWKRVRRRDANGMTIRCPHCRHALADHRRVGKRKECLDRECACGKPKDWVPPSKTPVMKICENCGKPYTGLLCPNWQKELLEV